MKDPLYNNYLILICLITLFFSCNQNPDFILINAEKEKIIAFPKEIDVTYNGLTIAKAELINKSGSYEAMYLEKNISLTNKSLITLIKTDFIGLDYEMTTDIISMNQSKNSNYKLDTLYYNINQKYLGHEKIDNVVETFKNLVDTLESKSKTIKK